MVLLHLQVALKSICNPETALTRTRGPEDYCLLLKLNTLKGCAQADLIFPKDRPVSSHMSG